MATMNQRKDVKFNIRRGWLNNSEHTQILENYVANKSGTIELYSLT